MMDYPENTWAVGQAILQSRLPAVTKLVLLTVAVLLHDSGALVYPPVKQIADATKLTERTVRKHLGIANNAGWDAASLVSNDKEGR